jgi:hypothetical protein
MKLLLDIGESFGDGFALGIAAGERRADHDIALIVFVGFEKHFEVAAGHFGDARASVVHRSEGLRWAQ